MLARPKTGRISDQNALTAGKGGRMLCALWRPVPGCRGCVFCSHVPDVAAWLLKSAATAPLRGRPTPFRPREGGVYALGRDMASRGLLLRSLWRSRMTSEYRPSPPALCRWDGA